MPTAEQNEPEIRQTALSQLLKAERAAKLAAERAEQWLQGLRFAAERAMTPVSLDDLLREALQAVADLLSADAASVLIASDDGQRLVARAAVGLHRDVDLSIRIESGSGVAGRILSSRAPLIVPDLTKLEMASPVLLESGSRSLAGVPLMAGAGIVGVLHVSSRTLDSFSEGDLDVLEILAEPLAAAIERVRLFEAERTARRRAEASVERLQALQRITAALAGTTTAEEVCRAVLEESAAGADEAEQSERGIWLFRGGRLVLVAGGERAHGFPEIPLDDSMPMQSHLFGGDPLFVETESEMIRRWPALEGSGTRSFAALTLGAGGRPIGVLAVGYSQEHRYDESERAYLAAVAEQASLALDRALQRERELAEQERRAVLAEASIALSKQHATPEAMLRELTQLAVPRLADECSVVLAERGRFVLVAASPAGGGGPAAHASPAGRPRRLVEQLSRTGKAILLDAAGQPSTLRGGEEGAGSEPASAGAEPGSAAVGGVPGPPSETTCIIVPLTAHGRVIGAMTFAAVGNHLPYAREDLELATELAERVSEAAEDVIARQRDRTLAAALTRVLLPTRFPQVEGLEFAARYAPADAGPVGGDWYDAFELPDGRIGLVIGDVAGHGVEAASIMGRLRNGTFAYATEGHPPQVLFERLAALLADPAGEWEDTDPLATVLYAIVDLGRLEVTTACAGHPPWLLARDRRAEYVKCTGRALVPDLPPFTEETTTQLAVGDTMVFFTDGLVERPTESLDLGLERLAESLESELERLAGATGSAGDAASGAVVLEDLCDVLLERTTPPGGRRDDCCLLAVRVSSRPRPPRP